ncbi:MAG: hypothetical protein QOE58_2210 [Actinomycetota bacterium]|jgi:hypothetical protein|nr:hypothetical protein [Actinomycetota bacterium]
MNPESVTVTAGLGGFLAFFLLAVALWLLMRNMNTRLRRMAYREELEAGGETTGADGSADDGPPSAGEKGGPQDGHDLR